MTTLVQVFKELVGQDHANMAHGSPISALGLQNDSVALLTAANGVHQEDYQVPHLFVNVAIKVLHSLKTEKTIKERKDQ